MMRHELWRALLSASADIDRQVASAAGEFSSLATASLPTSGASLPQYETWRDLGGASTAARSLSVASSPTTPGSPNERERERLGELRSQVRTRLDALWRLLEGETGYDRIRRALVIHFDERIMALLPEQLRLSWPLLQTELTRSTTGGNDFFRHIDEAIDDPKAPSLVFETNYFCIEHGFVGMYVHDPVRLEETKRRLALRISLPAVTHGSEALGEAESLPSSWPVWAYHMAAVALVVLVMALATAWSNSGTAGEHVEVER